jgi:subtilisin-like proprotein convertase family protein
MSASVEEIPSTNVAPARTDPRRAPRPTRRTWPAAILLLATSIACERDDDAAAPRAAIVERATRALVGTQGQTAAATVDVRALPALPDPGAPLVVREGGRPKVTGFRAAVDEGGVGGGVGGAVGPHAALLVSPSSFVVRDRGGGLFGAVSLHDFWGPLLGAEMPGAVTFANPRASFDAAAGRFILAAHVLDARGGKPTTYPVIAASANDDPSGVWSLYLVHGARPLPEDTLKIGVSKRWVSIGSTDYDTSGKLRHLFYAIDKGSLYGGGAARYTRFELVPAHSAPSPVRLPPTPASSQDADDAAYAVGTWQDLGPDLAPEGDRVIHLYELAGAIGAETLTRVATLRPPQPFDVGAIAAATLRSGALWFTYERGAGGATAIEWQKIDRAGAPLAAGRVDPGAAGGDLAAPSLAVNAQGDALLGYTVTAADGALSAGAAFVSATGGATARILRRGASGGGAQPPYSQAVVDPRDDLGLWTLQPYGESAGGFGAWWARFAVRRAGSSAVSGSVWTDANADGVRSNEGAFPGAFVYADLDGDGTHGLGSTELPAAGLPIAIADAATTRSTIAVANAGLVRELSVKVDLDHTWDDDLVLTLVAPSGKRVALSRGHGHNGDHYRNTTFRDDAARGLSEGSPPFSGEFRPDEPLSALVGAGTAGNWALEVQDRFRGNAGTLRSWSLALSWAEPSTNADELGDYVLELPPGSYQVRVGTGRRGPYASSPGDGAHQVTVASGAEVEGRDFGLFWPWW